MSVFNNRLTKSLNNEQSILMSQYKGQLPGPGQQGEGGYDSLGLEVDATQGPSSHHRCSLRVGGIPVPTA